MTTPTALKEALQGELSEIRAGVKTATDKLEAHFRTMKSEFDGKAKTDAEAIAELTKRTTEYGDLAAKVQALGGAVDVVKRQLEAPALAGGKDQADHDRRSAIELQRRKHVHKHGTDDGFKADLDNLVNVADLREAAKIAVRHTGLETIADVKKRMSEPQKRAFEAHTLDSNMFDPQILGYEMDCEALPANLLDLYGTFNVSKSAYKYLRINDYAAIGSYQCDAACEAELGPQGNMEWLEGKTYDFRGAFCLQKKTLQEANVDLLGHMMYAAQRSHFINRNKASVIGDGVNEPLGWLKANVFKTFKTKTAGKVDHIDVRRFMGMFPVERGRGRAIMHQNVFGYLAAQTDSTGRFIFGDGQMAFTPDDLAERIRISNWLDDATAGGTLGGAAPGPQFQANTFVLAFGAWESAYKTVNKRPMFMEQYMGKSSAWCVQYQFGAEDGGQVACPADAQILVIQ